MYTNIIKSKIGLVVIIILATFISINASRVDESILKNNISTPTILFTEGLFLQIAIIISCLIVPDVRKKMLSDMKKLTYTNIAMLGFYSLVGIGVAFIANDALLHHGTDEVKMLNLIIGFLITGLIYFFTTNKKLSLKKLAFFIALCIFSGLFIME
jgi:uncharacterized integral membrane protein